MIATAKEALGSSIAAVGLVVDVQPLAASAPGFGRCREHELTADPAPLVVGMDDGVQHEGVRAAVPANLDEPDEGASGNCADPGEAVTLQPPRPGCVAVAEEPNASRCKAVSASSSTVKRT